MKSYRLVHAPDPPNDWEAWKAQEQGIERFDPLDKAHEYALRGRL